MGNVIFIKDRKVCVKPLKSRIEAIQKLTPPTTPKGCRSGGTWQGANVLHLITEVKQSQAQLIHGGVTILLALLHSVIRDLAQLCCTPHIYKWYLTW